MNLHPVDERIIIKPIEEEAERKIGSIIIPDTAKEKPQIGEVIAIGDDVIKTNETRKKLSELVKVGDRIIYAKYGGSEIKIDNEEYMLISRNDILAVFK
ncbi:MAG: co-chaperone GroES [Candidatus Hatepunaea meridiana]|nr:co-chaperone GroES [Candidatus Hatepunaea meridiana]